MNPLLLIGVAAAVYFGFVQSTKQQVERLTITGASISKPVIQLLNTTLPVILQVFNPASSSLRFNYFQGYVSYNGRRIGNFMHKATEKNFSLAARATTPMQFNVTINNANLGLNIASLVKQLTSGTGNISTVFTIDGIYNAGGIDIPVKFSWDVKKNAIVKVQGIGKPYIKLEFDNNDKLENYLQEKKKLPSFSKN